MLNLIPEPQKLEQRHGSVSICPEFKIYASPVNAPAVQKLNCFLRVNRGYELEIKNIEHGNGLWVSKNLPETTGSIPDKGYRLDISDRIEIMSFNPEGIFYGVITLLQVLDSYLNLPCLSIVDAPKLASRIVHWDLKGLMPDFEYLKSAIEKLAYYKINAILVEYEDKFSYEKHPLIVNKNALSKSQVSDLQKIAKDNFIELIPLVQCLGHAEYVLRHPQYLYVAENVFNCQQYCPSNEKSFELFKDFINEILPLHDAKFIHIGGDEARQLGECPDCREKIKKNSKTCLYFEYVKKICEYIISLGKVPVMWDDMLTHNFRVDLMKALPRQTVICCWNYACHSSGMEYFCGPEHIRPFSRYWLKKCYGSFDEKKCHIARLGTFSGPLEKGEIACWEALDSKTKKRFKKYLNHKELPRLFNPFYLVEQVREAGLNYWGAGSAQCSEDGKFTPNFTNSLTNLKAWGDYLQDNGASAIVATAWSKGGALKPPNAPFATRWYPLVAMAEWSWSGKRCSEQRFDKKFCSRFFCLNNTSLTDALALCSASTGKLSVFINKRVAELAVKVERNQLEFEAIEIGVRLAQMEHLVLSGMEFCHKYIYQLKTGRVQNPLIDRLNFYLDRAEQALREVPVAAEKHLLSYMPLEEVEEYLNSITVPLRFQIDNMRALTTRLLPLGSA